MSKRKKLWLKIVLTPPVLVVVWLVGVFVVQLFWNQITPGRDTTFVTGPVVDGSIDYVAAVNEHFHQGLTRENNAGALLIRLRPASSFERPGLRERIWAMLEAGPVTDEYPEVPSLDADSFHTENADRFMEHSKRPWTAREDPDASAYVDLQERHLALVTEACKREKFWFPLVTPTPGEALITADQSWGYLRGFARALSVRAMRRLGEKDFAGFRDDVLTLHRFSGLIMQSSSLIGRLVGLGIEAMVSEMEANAAISGALSKEQSMQLLADLRAMPPFPELKDSVDWTERCSVLDLVSRLKSHKVEPTNERRFLAWPVRPLPIHYDAVLRRVNSDYDRMMTIEKLPPGEIWETGRSIAKGLEGDYDKLFGFEALGFGTNAAEIWAGNFSIYSSRPFELRDQTVEWNCLAQVTLAINAWRAERNAYPATLNDLPADLLQGAQRDIFSTGDVIYQRNANGFILYSVGLNTRDDGGRRNFTNGADQDDLVVNCPPLAEKKP